MTTDKSILNSSPPLMPNGHVARWIPGKTCNGMTGRSVDYFGHTGSRACQVCERRLDDVDGLGTHPECDPTGTFLFRLWVHATDARLLTDTLAYVERGCAGILNGTDTTVTVADSACQRHHTHDDVHALLSRALISEDHDAPTVTCQHDAETRTVIPLRLSPIGERFLGWLSNQ